jgi:hypothetical protein
VLEGAFGTQDVWNLGEWLAEPILTYQCGVSVKFTKIMSKLRSISVSLTRLNEEKMKLS